MTIQTRTAPASAKSSIKVERTDLDRIDEERSENEGMREHAHKALNSETREMHLTAKGADDSSNYPLAQHQPKARPTSAETTDLERRVLAHERILQALIAHITETEPKFLARLSERFSEPMQMVRREHDYTDTESHAEDFIRAVVRLGEEPMRESTPPVKSQSWSGRTAGLRGSNMPSAHVPARIQIYERGGVWQVIVDGRFYGQYMKEEHAQAVANNLT